MTPTPPSATTSHGTAGWRSAPPISTSRIGAVADDLGMSARLLAQPTSSLSGGEAARASLAALLLSRFDVYLLDEPTNDLDLDGLARLERWVLGLEAGVLLVSHDRRFLDRVVTDVVEIDEFTHGVTTFGGGWQAVSRRAGARPAARVGSVRRATTRRARSSPIAPSASASGRSRASPGSSAR